MNKNYTQYSPTQKNRLSNCKMNVVHLGSNETIRHELSKALGSIMVHKWGDVKWSNKITQLISDLEHEVETSFKGWVKETTPFITEAWLPNRRIDLVNLGTDDRFEFETSHTENKREKYDDDQTINIYI